MDKSAALKVFHDYFAGCLVTFGFYEKYTFSWLVVYGPYTMRVDYGGSADDIYRFRFDGQPWRIKSTADAMNEDGYSVTIYETKNPTASYTFEAD